MGITPADPRPVVTDTQISGGRCRACGFVASPVPRRCPRCRSVDVESARFGPDGAVWASTVVHLPVAGHTPPYAVAYVDLDGGPRVLAHVETARILTPGTRVRVTGARDGDVLVTAEGAA